MAKTNVTFTNFAAKKLLGKSQVRPSLTDAQEIFPSNVSMPGAGVFAEVRVPNASIDSIFRCRISGPFLYR